MKNLLTAITFILSAGIFAQCDDLFFSEYLEGASSNKAFEIYNPTNADIDLSDYVVYRNNNGSITPSDSLFPQGVLEAGDVFVVANPGAALLFIITEADTFHTMTFYNGDDALWLKKISSGDTLDVIGQIGVDPGSGWAVGSGATNNNTLIRRIDIQKGQQDWAFGATEWDTYPIDMDDSLGAHTMIPCFYYESVFDTACAGIFSPDGEEEWTVGGTYVDTVFVPGIVLDTIFTVNLTLNNTFDTVDVTTCDSLVSPGGGYTWYDTGTYLDTVPNILGCDSIITTNLTIINSSYATLTAETCDTYPSPDGEEEWTESGVYTDTLTNVVGCDSIITVDLTIHPSYNETVTMEGCDSLVSPGGTQVWMSSGTYTDTLLTVHGCDSVLTVDLTIFTIDNAVTQSGIELMADMGGITYQWLDCDAAYENIDGATTQTFTATENGNYAVQLTNGACVDTSMCFLITEVGILENNFDHLVAYPNPTQGQITIDLGETQPKIEVIITNISGQKIQESTFYNTPIISVEIDAEPGLYQIEIRAQSEARLKVLKY